METETEEKIAGQQQLQHQKAAPVYDNIKKKHSKEKVVAVASPQKGRSDMMNGMTGEMIKHQPATNNGSLRRPPGITILQYANILTNGREKIDRNNVCAPGADNKNRRPRQEGTSKSPATALKDQKALGDSHLLQKAVETPIQNYQNEFDEGENQTENPVLIDIEQEELKKSNAEENLLKLAISAANRKWHAEDEQSFGNSVEQYALDFLRSMNGTLCYLTAAFRMLAKAPWTSHMVSVHIRQAAMYAISQGWYVNTQKTHRINFSRAELAGHGGAPKRCQKPIRLFRHTYSPESTSAKRNSG